MTNLIIDAGSVPGLYEDEAKNLQELLQIYQYYTPKNNTKERYYEGKISLNEVNLGIALPLGMQGLEIGCSWGAKCVDVLAARSMFDGFVGLQGENVELLESIVQGNQLVPEYMKACRDELKFGCTFATLSGDPARGCKIRFHSPRTAAARWSGEKGRIECGLSIIDMAKDPVSQAVTPSLIRLDTDQTVIILRNVNGKWITERYPHRMGRPLMEPLVWNATSGKPFGRSRIKEPIRRLIQSYVRTMANAAVGLEFATAPQKYILGLTDEQYDVIVGQKFKQYVGSIIAATANPETGEKPSFGQLAQGSITPHVEMIRLIATQFSAATGLPVTDTGVINDANPSSSDAIEAQTKTLVGLAEDLNAGNGAAMKTIAMMALAIAQDKTMEELSEDERAVVAHFKNPSMPNISVSADAALKIVSARQSFSSTDKFLEMVGFSQADIRRIKAQEVRARGLSVLSDMEFET